MSDYSYKLFFNGNLRWIDYRSSNPAYTVDKVVRIDITTFDNSNQTLCHIHNWHTRCVAEDDKHVKTMFSAPLGVGCIAHEIFGQMKYYEFGLDMSDYSNFRDGLWIGYSMAARLVYLVDSDTFSTFAAFLVKAASAWHFIPLVDMKNLPLVLAIPLSHIGVK